MNHYPRHIGDYAKDAAHLTMLEDGAYVRMMDLYYASEKPLPANRGRLYVVLRAISRQERAAVDSVLSQFFIERQDGWHQKRCDAELGVFRERSAKAADSASKRWQSKRNANAYADADAKAYASAMPAQSEGNASHKPLPISQAQQPPPVDNSTSAPAAAAPPGAHAAEMAEVLRALGVSINAENQHLAEWIANGATETLLLKAVAKARERKPDPAPIPAAYLAHIVADLLAAGAEKPQRVNGIGAWWTTDAAANAAARKLGIAEARAGESRESFHERIRAAIAEQQVRSPA